MIIEITVETANGDVRQVRANGKVFVESSKQHSNSDGDTTQNKAQKRLINPRGEPSFHKSGNKAVMTYPQSSTSKPVTFLKTDFDHILVELHKRMDVKGIVVTTTNFFEDIRSTRPKVEAVKRFLIKADVLRGTRKLFGDRKTFIRQAEMIWEKFWLDEIL